MATQSKKDLLKRHVKDIDLKRDMTVRELIDGMENVGGFSAQHMVDGIKILDSMLKDKDSFNFLSFPADIVATGLRGALAASVKYFDAIITTCGTLDHDLARAHGGVYSLGSFYADDAKLFKEKIYRLGNVFIEQKEYGRRGRGLLQRDNDGHLQVPGLQEGVQPERAAEGVRQADEGRRLHNEAGVPAQRSRSSTRA